MKYTDKALKEWRDSIEPAAPHGECLHFTTDEGYDAKDVFYEEGQGHYEKVAITNCCYDGDVIILLYSEPCRDYVKKETLFPPDYLGDAE